MANAKVNAKTEKLRKYFADNKMEMFVAQDVGDANETTVLRTRMEIGKTLLPMAILIDKSAYMLIQVELMPKLVAADKFNKFAKSLNALNNAVRLFKFTLSGQGDLMLNATLTFPDEQFEPVLFHAILVEIMKYLDKDYNELTKAVMQVMK